MKNNKKNRFIILSNSCVCGFVQILDQSNNTLIMAKLALQSTVTPNPTCSLQIDYIKDDGILILEETSFDLEIMSWISWSSEVTGDWKTFFCELSMFEGMWMLVPCLKYPMRETPWIYHYYYMETSEPKWVNPVLNTIGVNSLRLGGLEISWKFTRLLFGFSTRTRVLFK